MSLTRKGRKLKPLSDEHKLKISLATKGRIITEEARKKLSLTTKGKKLTEEHKRKIGLAHLGKKRKPFSEEAKNNMAKARIKLWQNSEYRQKRKVKQRKKRSLSCL